MMIRWSVLVCAVLLLGCGSSGSGGDSTCEGDVCYRVSFTEVWNAANFPTQYPTSSHFSPLIGAAHGPAADFYEMGQSASAGIESMAETGGTSVLSGEVQTAIDAGDALQEIRGDGIPHSETSTRAEFGVSDAFPLVTLVSMVAPSPDWFVGVDSLNLKDMNGDFYDTLSVDLRVYDAGSDQGVTFTSGNSDSNDVITELSCADLMNDCGFTDGLGTDGVQFIGSFVFEKL